MKILIAAFAALAFFCSSVDNAENYMNSEEKTSMSTPHYGGGIVDLTSTAIDVNIKLQTFSAGIVQMKIMDSSGKIHYTNEFYLEDTIELKLPKKNFNSETYTLKIIFPEGEVIEKFDV